MSLPTFRAILTQRRSVTPNVGAFCFRRIDAAPMQFQAGQWVQVLIPTHEGSVKRAYSIASAPGTGPDFELAVTHVTGGTGSSSLHSIDVGAELEFTEPAGFFVRKGDHPSLFVATGTGLTPLYSMMLDAIHQGHQSPMVLLIGVRREEDRLYAQELQALAAAHSHVQVFYTLSQSRSEEGLRGYVQAHVPRLHAELSARANDKAHVYICGLEKMVTAVRAVCKENLGLTREHIHSERYD